MNASELRRSGTGQVFALPCVGLKTFAGQVGDLTYSP
jgi:hypothetical protein